MYFSGDDSGIFGKLRVLPTKDEHTGAEIMYVKVEIRFDFFHGRKKSGIH